ncbi:HAMP domain-containing sensor histidine kinase [Pleionea sp. CnH1-48]|uniref:sensor histidine kinase n=1 Tax=Pleionea sp. CnH1-48 TaxID=2954494 RepID=UPI00209704B6|nr:HAMP domain-containing sensor histidine kinase [Pleionea sp. CnH1-48]MCO7227062.1 HAMP domain-containing histidine kinase [Pleionea sp. CnH1-48]
MVEDNVFNRLVAEEAEFLERGYRQEEEIKSPRSPFFKLYSGWSDLPVSVYQQHLKDPEQVEFELGNKQTIHVKPIHLDGKTWVLVADVSKFEVGKVYLPFVSVSLIVIMLVILLAALALAFIVGRKAVSPLKILTYKVEKSKGAVLEKGFYKQFPSNEVGFLAKKIEESILHNQELLQREANFTRDVSHELRTPITILKNLLSEIKRHPNLSEKQREQYSLSISNIEQTVQTLLALAREESAQVEVLNILHVLENCIVDHYGLINRDDFLLDIHLPDDFMVKANLNLLKILFNNLLSNALEYSSSGSLSISSNGLAIIFSNESDINVSEPLACNSKAESSKGIGQGLFLVKRICELFGWQVSTQSEQNNFCLIIDTAG